MITNIYNIILLLWDIRDVYQDVNLIIRRTSQVSRCLNFPAFGELRQKMLQNIPRKFDKITQSTRVCIKYFEDKDVHGFNIHTNPDGTTYTVSDVVLIKLFYLDTRIITNIISMLNMVICKLFFMTTDVVVRSGFLLVVCDF